jgi:hypothetical protein
VDSRRVSSPNQTNQTKSNQIKPNQTMKLNAVPHFTLRILHAALKNSG